MSVQRGTREAVHSGLVTGSAIRVAVAVGGAGGLWYYFGFARNTPTTEYSPRPSGFARQDEAGMARSLAPIPSESAAQRMKVARLPQLLSDDEVTTLTGLAAKLRQNDKYKKEASALALMAASGSGLTSVALKGVYKSRALREEEESRALLGEEQEEPSITTFLHFRRTLLTEAPALFEKLIAAARVCDSGRDGAPGGWRLLQRATGGGGLRTIELRDVGPAYKQQRAVGEQAEGIDSGSLVTMNVMLAEPGVDFTGGELTTIESGGFQKHKLAKGDALVFPSHKYHSFADVETGRRQVLSLELWDGDMRECAHRCDQRLGACTVLDLQHGAINFEPGGFRRAEGARADQPWRYADRAPAATPEAASAPKVSSDEGAPQISSAPGLPPPSEPPATPTPASA